MQGCMFGMRALLSGRSGIVLMGIVLRRVFIRRRPHVWRAHGKGGLGLQVRERREEAAACGCRISAAVEYPGATATAYGFAIAGA